MHLPIGVSVLILLSAALHAQHPLAYVVDARLASLAGSGAALSGPSAVWLNPAGLGEDYDWSYGASVTQLTGISQVKQVTGQVHLRQVAVHLAATRLEKYHALRYGITYARPIAAGLRIGGGLAVFRQGVAGYPAQAGVVASLGGQLALSPVMRIGAYAAVPSDRSAHAYRMGAGLRYAVSGRATFLLDIRYDGTWGWSTHYALAYAPGESLTIRLGYDGGAGAFTVGSSYAFGQIAEADVVARYHPLLGGGGGAGFRRAGSRQDATMR